MINVNDFKNGQTINYDGNLYQVLDFNHVKPGKGAAIVKAKLKNLRTGSIAEYTFNAGIKVPTAHVEKQKMQFLYADGDNYSFMNMETYEQVELNKKQIANEVKYLKDGEVKNTYEVVIPKKLKQFAEKLKNKLFEFFQDNEELDGKISIGPF